MIPGNATGALAKLSVVRELLTQIINSGGTNGRSLDPRLLESLIQKLPDQLLSEMIAAPLDSGTPPRSAAEPQIGAAVLRSAGAARATESADTLPEGAPPRATTATSTAHQGGRHPGPLPAINEHGGGARQVASDGSYLTQAALPALLTANIHQPALRTHISVALDPALMGALHFALLSRPYSKRSGGKRLVNKRGSTPNTPKESLPSDPDRNPDQSSEFTEHPMAESRGLELLRALGFLRSACP
jgi:hypothetical protein